MGRSGFAFFAGFLLVPFEERIMFRRCAVALGVLSAIVFASSVQADVFNMGGTRDPATGTWTGTASLEFVTVGDPGNAADTATGSRYGSVPYVYQMGKYDVTVGQYCQFLNAVAKTDTYGLYNSLRPWATEHICRPSESPRAAVRAATAYSVTGGYSQAGELSDLRCHVGRRRPVLQLAAKRPAHTGGRKDANGNDGERGVHAQRRDHADPP